MKIISDEIKQLLETSRQPWRIETGGRHYKILINEKLVSILPLSPHARKRKGNAQRNVIARLRRILKEQVR